MKILLKTSGGLANIRIEGQLDTTDLEPELARKLEELPEKLQTATTAAEAAPESLPMADAQQYEVSILPDDPEGEARTFTVDDSCPEGEVLDVLDELRFEIVRRKAEALDEQE